MENWRKAEYWKKVVQTGRFFAVCVILFILTGVESAAIRIFSFQGALPLLSLTFCICLSLCKEPLFALSVSLIGGVLSDFSKGSLVGTDCLLYLYISAGCVWLSAHVFVQKRWILALCVFCSVIVYGFLSSIIQRWLVGTAAPAFLMRSGIYGAVLAWIFGIYFSGKEV